MLQPLHINNIVWPTLRVNEGGGDDDDDCDDDDSSECVPPCRWVGLCLTGQLHARVGSGVEHLVNTIRSQMKAMESSQVLKVKPKPSIAEKPS